MTGGVRIADSESTIPFLYGYTYFEHLDSTYEQARTRTVARMYGQMFRYNLKKFYLEMKIKIKRMKKVHYNTF